ncbi:MAG: hypothetical protein ACLFVK_08115 [Dehalococcoidia bacterium]
MRIEHPELSLSQIATQVGRTKERVRQVLVEEGLPTRALRPKRYCPNCGKEVTHSSRKFCSQACYHDYHRTMLRCGFCGREFRRTKSRAHIDKKRNKYTFCSKTCQGKWLARWYGLGIRATRKLDYEKIRRLYDEGYNGRQIARLMGENARSVYGAVYIMGLRFRQCEGNQLAILEQGDPSQR